MGEYERNQRNQLSRTIQNNGGGSRQLKSFVDNKPPSIIVFQLAADKDLNGTHASTLRYRNLVLSAPQQDWHSGKECIIVTGDPGFGMNIGHIEGNGHDITSVNNGDIHSEPILIGSAYGGNFPRNWAHANEAIENENGKTSNDKHNPQNRNKFSLWSERPPCGSCSSNLHQNIYSSDDKVYHAVDGDTTAKTGAIRDAHINRARTEKPGWDYSSASDCWKIDGTRPLICEHCGHELILINGKFGLFWGCSNWSRETPHTSHRKI